MLQFESAFWVTKNKETLIKKFQALGFNISPSVREPSSQAVFFGPESIELVDSTSRLQTLTDTEALSSFAQHKDGVFGVGLESDDIAADYHRMKALSKNIEKPRRAKDTQKDIPIWLGFNLPAEITPSLRAWVLMNSKEFLEQQSREVLPATHSNTCFGIEALHLVCNDPDPLVTAWGKIFSRAPAGLQWNELAPTAGKRFQTGARFFDLLRLKPSSPLAAITGQREGVFMMTLKVTDLELAKEMAVKAGAEILPCNNRDGFIISSEFTGGPALRLVRAYWKRHLPTINNNFPFGRRTDQFRPLGGAYSSTLEDGFEDNWKF